MTRKRSGFHISTLVVADNVHCFEDAQMVEFLVVDAKNARLHGWAEYATNPKMRQHPIYYTRAFRIKDADDHMKLSFAFKISCVMRQSLDLNDVVVLVYGSDGKVYHDVTARVDIIQCHELDSCHEYKVNGIARTPIEEPYFIDLYAALLGEHGRQYKRILTTIKVSPNSPSPSKEEGTTPFEYTFTDDVIPDGLLVDVCAEIRLLSGEQMYSQDYFTSFEYKTVDLTVLKNYEHQDKESGDEEESVDKESKDEVEDDIERKEEEKLDEITSCTVS